MKDGMRVMCLWIRSSNGLLKKNSDKFAGSREDGEIIDQIDH
jgi:hypothetical protein